LKCDNIDYQTVTQRNDDKIKEIVSAIFVALLAAEFILTPVLKPIILAARDSSMP
jgi:hypothetical protein